MFALFFSGIGCYGADPGTDPSGDPPGQQAQAGGSGPCIGPCAPTYTGVFVVDGSPAWFDAEGIDLIVPSVRCINAVTYPAWVPVGTACENVWGRTSAPQTGVSTPGNWAARVHVQGSAIPVNSPAINLWFGEELWNGGVQTRFRWKLLQMRRRAEGVMFRLATYGGTPLEQLPFTRTDGSCGGLFTYVPTSLPGDYQRLQTAGYQLDLIGIAAFRPAASLFAARRVGRVQGLPAGLLPPTGNPPFSPQAVYRPSDGCWFAVNYGDSDVGVFPINLATADEYLRNSFNIQGP